MPGDAVFSTHPNYQIVAGDLITFTWSQPIPDGQVIVRGAGTTSDNTARETQLEEDEDRLNYHAVSSIWCEDENGKVYRSQGDFILNGSKVIKWVGESPHRGATYTIKYNAHIEWIAFTPPNIRRDRNRDLGSRVALRKRHVALVNDNPTLRVGDRVPFCSRLQGC
jgi:hypothetical protein